MLGLHCVSLACSHYYVYTAEDLKASSVAQQPVKKDKEEAPKKKKRGRRALKITNTHMKALVSSLVCRVGIWLIMQGIDFTKDYEGPS